MASQYVAKMLSESGRRGMTDRDDTDYPEIKHCRSCGKLILTTMEPPLCDECWLSSNLDENDMDERAEASS